MIQNVYSPQENIPRTGIAKSGITSHRLLPFLFCHWVLGLFIIVSGIGDGGSFLGVHITGSLVWGLDLWCSSNNYASVCTG